MTEFFQFAIIPAFDPTAILNKIIAQLIALAPELTIVVVDDGSTAPEAANTFSLLQNLQQVTVLRHEQNQGKGAALKTGFSYLMKQGVDEGTVVTLDADGQHLVEDVLNVIRSCDETGAPALGVRELGRDTPFRSLVGNRVTSFLLVLLFNIRLGDTQTGLRAVPASLLPSLVKVEGERYDYELRQLTQVLARYGLVEIPIRTVYLDGNRGSHFNPLLDSMKIYWVFCRHALVSLIVGALDFAILYSLIILGNVVEVAVLVARAISVSIYFSAISRSVFRTPVFSLAIIVKFGVNLGINILLFPKLFSEVAQIASSTFLSVLVTYLVFYVFNFMFQRWVVFTGAKDNA